MWLSCIWCNTLHTCNIYNPVRDQVVGNDMTNVHNRYPECKSLSAVASSRTLSTYIIHQNFWPVRKRSEIYMGQKVRNRVLVQGQGTISDSSDLLTGQKKVRNLGRIDVDGVRLCRSMCVWHSIIMSCRCIVIRRHVLSLHNYSQPLLICAFLVPL